MSLMRTSAPSAPGLDDDVFELRRLGQPAHGAHADLVELLDRRRRIAERAGRDLQVLLAQRVDDVPRGHVAAASFAGSSQSRIANFRSPNWMTLPTPGTRLIASLT